MKSKNLLFVMGLSLCCAGFAPAFAADYVIADPPVAGSAQDVDDLAQVLKSRALRTPELCRDAELDVEPMFAKAFTGILTSEEMRRVLPRVRQIVQSAVPAIEALKAKYQRPRPFLRDPQVQPCVQPPDGYSYPSGHSTVAAAVACVLAAEFADRREAILNKGIELGDWRVWVGVHHPSDVAAGRDLGRQICAEALQACAIR